jgi:hypothetical protein
LLPRLTRSLAHATDRAADDDDDADADAEEGSSSTAAAALN